MASVVLTVLPETGFLEISSRDGGCEGEAGAGEKERWATPC